MTKGHLSCHFMCVALFMKSLMFAILLAHLFLTCDKRPSKLSLYVCRSIHEIVDVCHLAGSFALDL